MPHHFVNRRRLYDRKTAASSEPDATSEQDSFRWERFNAIAYQAGGLVFIVGSLLFFPALEAYANLGAWAFFLGSLFYLVVTGHDMVEVIFHARTHTGPTTIWDKLEFVAVGAYLTGTLLFMVGSILFLSTIDLISAGAWCFVVGSLLFVLGATVNVLQIIQAQDLHTLQLMNLTALTFVTGSVLFSVASVPYLWSIDTPADKRIIDSFAAWQYLVGSLLFFLGGVFNYRRAWLVMRGQISAAAS